LLAAPVYASGEEEEMMGGRDPIIPARAATALESYDGREHLSN
jgi:hypothetical protein